MTALVFLIFELRAAALSQTVWEISIFISYRSASLSLLGSSIFLACWCLCCLWSGVCLFACTGLSFLFHPCLCAWNSAEQGKSGGRTKPQDLCQWPGHHSQGTRTIGVFTPSLPQWFCLQSWKNCVFCSYSELKLSHANLFGWEGLADARHFAEILSHSRSTRIYSGMAKSQSFEEALKGWAGR